jgi:hypothetical protein
VNVQPIFQVRRTAWPADRAGRLARTFGLLGGPAAWYLQLCAGYVMASGPCFPHERRLGIPAEAFGWTWPALVVVLIAGVAVALAACWMSWRLLSRTQRIGSGPGPLEIDAGRERFLALWGMVFGAGFAVATLITAVASIVLPRCAG